MVSALVKTPLDGVVGVLNPTGIEIVFEQDTLSLHSTGKYPRSGGSIPT